MTLLCNSKKLNYNIIPKNTLIIVRGMKRVIAAANSAIPKGIRPCVTPINRNVCYRVDNANAMTTTYDQSQVNPLLKAHNGKPFQHPAYVGSYCDLPDCPYKLCYKPCGEIVQEADVGHATHSNEYPNVKYVSTIDSSGQARPEFMVSYEKPIENTTSGHNINTTKTNNLNNNREALNNVHINSSKLPIQKSSAGSDEFKNIN